MPVSIESLLLEISDLGWLVANLFQLADGTWQANLRTTTCFTDYGQAPDPATALSLAIDKIAAAEAYLPKQPISFTIDGRTETVPVPSLSSLLNLNKPTSEPKITRRI